MYKILLILCICVPLVLFSGETFLSLMMRDVLGFSRSVFRMGKRAFHWGLAPAFIALLVALVLFFGWLLFGFFCLEVLNRADWHCTTRHV